MVRPVATALACASLSIVTGIAAQFSLLPVQAAAAAAGHEISSLSDADRSSDIITASIPPSASRPDGALDTSTTGDGDAADRSEAEDEPAKGRSARDEICEVLEDAAEEHDLPVPLFTRLIWQESRFRPKVVSHAGARGIAQFMPATAAERGLKNPFDPAQALPASAEFLRELVDQFGNFGLAAAAYNGGPNRLSRWLAGKGGLPRETREYVIHITGQSAEHWAEATSYGEPHPEANEVEDCKVRPISAAANLLKRSPDRKERWGVQLAGNWSEKKALATYAKLRKKYPNVLDQRHPTIVTTKAARKRMASKTIVRVVADTRSEAESMCKRLKEAGGSCSVQKISS